ncbi:MAG: hypothetical protein CL484_12065 [Acidobacteria bacterium]|nr:hypothetical protein [Acidobacteriota bacterium]|tara:strand:- start:3176 stop:3904 length:729 start_codon:yes stop_codon:yes gene_type:complete
MSKVVLTPLDRDKAKQSQIQQVFTDLATALNTTKVSENDIEPGALHYRHLSESPKFNLAARYGTAYGSTIDSTAVSAGGKNWYRIAASLIKFADGATGLPNLYENNRPVIQVYGPFHTNHAGVTVGDNSTASTITEVCIGVSTDSGSSWTPMMTTRRSIGQTCGGTFAWFKGSTHLHPITGASGYQPYYGWDRAVWLVGSFGGEFKNGASNGNRWYTVFVDANTTNDGQFYGMLFGDMRRLT